MHQGLTTKVLLVIAACFIVIQITIHKADAQLNSSSEIIETIEDIQIQDDSDRVKKENPNKPKFDEEFSKEAQPVEDEFIQEDEMVAEPDEGLSNEGNSPKAADRKELNQQKEQSYEEELKKNADKNKLDRREIFPEDMKNFEIDTTDQAQPTPEPKSVVESPRRDAAPPPPEIEDEIESEISQIPEETTEEPVVEEKTRPIEYAPEPTGPVIVYENEKKISESQRKSLSERTKVEIEPDPFIEGTLSQKIGDYLKPFKERRPTWTRQLEIGAAQYDPVNYNSIFINPTNGTDLVYLDLYEPDMPMPTLSFEFKRNFSFGAISLGGGASYYSGSSDTSEFTIISPSLKVGLYLDTLFDEPYIVPYATFGYAYSMFEETADSGEEYKGASDNFYVALGLLFQLDWLDRDADQSSFDMGIENTFIFVEGKTYLDAGINGIDEGSGDYYGDFSAPFFISAGLKLEF